MVYVQVVLRNLLADFLPVELAVPSGTAFFLVNRPEIV